VELPSGLGFVGSVKFVVVSMLVSVMGAGVSPGPLIVDVTPLADPSCTVWYCCWPRCILLDLLHAATRTTNETTATIFLIITLDW
jgi:hypothetical protein